MVARHIINIFLQLSVWRQLNNPIDFLTSVTNNVRFYTDDVGMEANSTPTTKCTESERDSQYRPGWLYPGTYKPVSCRFPSFPHSLQRRDYGLIFVVSWFWEVTWYTYKGVLGLILNSVTWFFYFFLTHFKCHNFTPSDKLFRFEYNLPACPTKIYKNVFRNHFQ